jgi:pyruvate formate lyase activating enzyme
MKKALLFESLSGQRVRCLLCAHHCAIGEGQLGVCGVRKNIGGELFSLSYDRVAAIHEDPIEKKPLYHFLPATPSFSVATMGCNFSCSFCQNHSLSVVENEDGIYGEKRSPRELVDMARASGCRSMAYTYTEPTVFFELMLETSRLAGEAGLKNVMVTNGYMSREALETITPHLDGANVDLKSFSDEFYRRNCGARLSPVLDTIQGMREAGIWIEVTTLLIPGLNTSPDNLKSLIGFIVSVDPDIPWHVSRFFPQYRMTDRRATDEELIFNTLGTARDMGLRYVYGGNVHSDDWSHTHCPECGELLIQRRGYQTRISRLERGQCGKCGTRIAGVWE